MNPGLLLKTNYPTSSGHVAESQNSLHCPLSTGQNQYQSSLPGSFFVSTHRRPYQCVVNLRCTAGNEKCCGSVGCVLLPPTQVLICRCVAGAGSNFLFVSK